MPNHMQKRICALIMLSVMMASFCVCSLSFGISDNADGLFYALFHKPFEMSDGRMEKTSLGPPPMPGHSIKEDYRQEALLKGQQFSLKCITMLFVILAIYACLWCGSYKRAGIIRKVRFRLLI